VQSAPLVVRRVATCVQLPCLGILPTNVAGVLGMSGTISSQTPSFETLFNNDTDFKPFKPFKHLKIENWFE
jgi:hypothetical protein